MSLNQFGSLARDDNDYPVMGGTSNVDNKTIINSSFDPITRRLLTTGSGGSGSITVTDGVTTVNNVTTLDFTSGATVTAGATGTADVAITAGGSGTVTTVSVVTANGFAGTVANATSTPAITLTTSITGVLKGNGTAISAATAGTDYSVGTSALATGLLKSTTSTGALSIATAGTDYQAPISLTTTGTSGVATFISNTLNVPNYTYTLPTATTSVLGGVKVDGTSITISGGVISATTGGSGTVTSVSVTTANGVSGTVATATTTPAITLTLGAITPSSVNSVVLSGSSTPTLSVTGTTTVSGTNTGDQTSVTGNAGTATTLQTARTIGIATGDVTSAGSTFDGSANNTNALTLATVNSNTGSFGSATAAPSFTVNGKGLITAAGTNTITPAVGSITGFGTGVATFLATPSSANLAAAVTDETGSGALVFATSPTLTTAVLGSSTATTQSPSDNSTKVATTAYVDAAVLGQNFKEAALVATTANLVGVYVSGVFTYTATGTDNIDGVNLALGNRVLVKNQTTTFQNGIYVVTTAGSLGVAGVLTRSSDANTSGEFKTGDALFVTSGTVNASTTWAYTGVDSPNLGTDAITYAQIAGLGSYVAGNGLTLTGNSFAIDTSITVDKTTAQTLTNKTLTSPTLTTPVINGLPTGTGVASGATASTLVTRDANANINVNNTNEGYTTTTTSGGTTTLTVASTYYQFFTGSSNQTVALPAGSTLVLGQTFVINNWNSAGTITVKDSGGSTVWILLPDAVGIFTCISTSGVGSWVPTISSVIAGIGKLAQFNNSLTLAGTDGTTFTFPSSSATVYTTATGSITSAQLATSLSDETGSGSAVFATSPTISGATITTSSVNGVTLTTGGGTTTFLNANGAYSAPPGSGTVNSGTAGQLTYYASTGTAVSGNARLLYSNSVSTPSLDIGITNDQATLILQASGGGALSITPVTSASGSLTLPTGTDTVVARTSTDTLTNKTLTSPVLTTPVINGVSTGTGVASAATASTLSLRDVNGNLSAVNFIDGATTTATAAGTTTLTVGSNNIQVFTGSTTQTVTMPVASTLVIGQQWYFLNLSTGAVTINSSGGNAIVILAGLTAAELTCTTNSGTTNTSWTTDYKAVSAVSGKKSSFSNSLTLAGTDGTTLTFPSTSATIARTDAAQTFTGVQTFSSAPVLSTDTITVGAGTNTFQAVTDTVVYRATTDTLTNKRINPRVVSTTQSATPAIDTDNGDIFEIVGLAQAITSMTSSLTGTPVEGNFFEVIIKDNGTARGITWGASFVSSTATLPTTTVISTPIAVLLQWRSSTIWTATSAWYCVAVA